MCCSSSTPTRCSNRTTTSHGRSQELYQAAGIASAWGSVLPLRERDRRVEDESAAMQAFRQTFHCEQPRPANWLRRFARGVTNTYREVLYLFLQRFVFRGQMALFGTVSNPAGCAVAYRREYLEALFDAVEPQLGDDLTNSEDIFIGFAMLNEGYRNIQVLDVCARTVEPEVQRLPKQIYLWSSAFLQSAFYFDALLKSPFKALKRWPPRPPSLQWIGRRAAAGCRVGRIRWRMLLRQCSPAPPGSPFVDDQPDERRARPARIGRGGDARRGRPFRAGERRRIQAPYRQAFGQRAHAGLRAAGRLGAAVVRGRENRFPDRVPDDDRSSATGRACSSRSARKRLISVTALVGRDEGPAAGVLRQGIAGDADSVCAVGCGARDDRAVRVGHVADQAIEGGGSDRPWISLSSAFVLFRGEWLRAIGGSRRRVLPPKAPVNGRKALDIYKNVLDREPHDASLWVRVADIEARARQPRSEAPRHCSAPSGEAPRGRGAPQRLSQAYAVIDQPLAALEAIERALALSPDSVEFLRARATLATWSRRLRPGTAIPIAVCREAAAGRSGCCARASRASAPGPGRTDAAVDAYGRYLRARARTPPPSGLSWQEPKRGAGTTAQRSGAPRELSERGLAAMRSTPARSRRRPRPRAAGPPKRSTRSSRSSVSIRTTTS